MTAPEMTYASGHPSPGSAPCRSGAPSGPRRARCISPPCPLFPFFGLVALSRVENVEQSTRPLRNHHRGASHTFPFPAECQPLPPPHPWFSNQSAQVTPRGPWLFSRCGFPPKSAIRPLPDCPRDRFFFSRHHSTLLLWLQRWHLIVFIPSPHKPFLPYYAYHFHSKALFDLGPIYCFQKQPLENSGSIWAMVEAKQVLVPEGLLSGVDAPGGTGSVASPWGLSHG